MSFMFLRVRAEIFKIGNMKIYERLKIKKSSDYKFGQQLIFLIRGSLVIQQPAIYQRMWYIDERGFDPF